MDISIDELAPSSAPLDWHFSQVFGERAPNEDIQEGKTLNCLPSVTWQLEAKASSITWHACVGLYETAYIFEIFEVPRMHISTN